MMKKILPLVLVFICLSSCTKDLEEYFSRADELEMANGAQKDSNKEQKDSNQDQKDRNKDLGESADSLRNRIDSLLAAGDDPLKTKLLSMEFLSSDNPTLNQNIKCEILGDSVVECWIPGINANKQLIPHFEIQGNSITIDGSGAISGTTKHDFRVPVPLVVTGADKTVKYMVYVHSYTGLPILKIDTEGEMPIISKEEYLTARMTLTEDVVTRSAGKTITADLQIKGRGNSTWGLPKKPYRMKFFEKTSLLGESKDKSWVLLANYTDKSMLRNQLAFYLGQMSNLDWTPSGHFVEVILNGKYNGTYLLAEKIKVANHRVAVGDDGFLLEVEARAPDEDGSRYFFSNHIDYAIDISEPEVEFDDDNFNYIQDYVLATEEALFGPFFRDANEGWQRYIDLDSFVDWYLIHEIAKNEDSMFHYSCYMNLKRGGKLKMGPIWDFDIAFGNVKEKNTTAMKPEGLMLDWSQWYTRLFQDPVFVAKLKERYNYFYRHKTDLLSSINRDAQYLRYSAQENQNKWGTFYHYTYKQYDIWGSYQNEVQSLKEWLNTRMEWLKNYFDRL